MYWQILDFLLKLLIASGLIALLICVWAIIINAVVIFLKE
jgi:hypothetical protein